MLKSNAMLPAVAQARKGEWGVQLQRANRRRRKQSTARSSKCKLAWLQKQKASNEWAAIERALVLLAASAVVAVFLPWAILAEKPMSLSALRASNQ